MLRPDCKPAIVAFFHEGKVHVSSYSHNLLDPEEWERLSQLAMDVVEFVGAGVAQFVMDDETPSA